MSASVVVLIGCAVLGLLRAGVRETCKCGFFKEMTRWTKMRTNVSLCSRQRGGLVRSTLLCGEKSGNRGGGGEGVCWSRGGGRLKISRIVSGRFWGAGALAEVGLRCCVSAIETGQVLGAGGRVSELWRVPQGMGDGGSLEACVPLCPGGGGEGGRRGGGRCRAVCDVL